MHEDAFAAAGIKGHYHLMDVDVLGDRADFAQLFDAVRIGGFAGTNVTFPFKEAVLALLDEIDRRRPSQIGAVNTVVIGRDGRTRGDNTDRSGFRRSFEETIGKACRRGPARGAGRRRWGRAGGRLRADRSWRRETVDSRQGSKPRRQSLPPNVAGTLRRIVFEAATDLAAAMRGADGVVNATPIGMHGFPGDPVAEELIAAEQWIADVIYTPLETHCHQGAKRKGCRDITGGGMCVHQAAEAFRLFTGISPDIERMRHVCSPPRQGAGRRARRSLVLPRTKGQSHENLDRNSFVSAAA